jgi:IgA peptidase M64
MKAYLAVLHFAIITCLASHPPVVQAQIHAAKVVDNGPDGQKLVLAILGDGYATADQMKFRDDVNRLILNGLFSHDFYKTNHTAFNVYRVDLVSRESGVSTPFTKKDTALKMVYSGDWNRCWMEESADTDRLVNNALVSVPKYDFALIILNESGWGGCSEGIRLFVTSGINWDVVAHEYGHSIGSLYDEYWVKPGSIFSGPPVNRQNVSSILDRTQVVWSKMIAAPTPIPTVIGSGIDSNQTVGMFEGANYAEKGVYRPAYDCRMRSNVTPFCPICAFLMQSEIAPYLSQLSLSSNQAPSFGIAAVQNPANLRTTGGYLHLVVRVTTDGETEVLKATEVQGVPVLRETPASQFVYEFSTTEKPLVAESLTEDPFVERSISDPANSLGHHFARTKSTTIIIKVPNITLSQLRETTPRLRLYQIEPNAKFATINATNIQVLTSQRQLRMQYDYSKPAFRDQIIKQLDNR